MKALRHAEINWGLYIVYWHKWLPSQVKWSHLQCNTHALPFYCLLRFRPFLFEYITFIYFNFYSMYLISKIDPWVWSITFHEFDSVDCYFIEYQASLPDSHNLMFAVKSCLGVISMDLLICPNILFSNTGNVIVGTTANFHVLFYHAIFILPWSHRLFFLFLTQLTKLFFDGTFKWV